jgi:hypothetical protein
MLQRKEISFKTKKTGENMDNDKVDGYSIPQDPMDLLQCESCQ